MLYFKSRSPEYLSIVSNYDTVDHMEEKWFLCHVGGRGILDDKRYRTVQY